MVILECMDLHCEISSRYYRWLLLKSEHNRFDYVQVAVFENLWGLECLFNKLKKVENWEVYKILCLSISKRYVLTTCCENVEELEVSRGLYWIDLIILWLWVAQRHVVANYFNHNNDRIAIIELNYGWIIWIQERNEDVKWMT